jgi:type II secretory ATPase GspE/PulE/Tfp pilus assembly ATPase PilB-like protein
MNKDEEQQARYRAQEETNTQQRAAILGLRYIDTRGMAATAELFPDIMSLKDMYGFHIVPLRRGDDGASYVFGITTNTPQSAAKTMQQQYNDQGRTVEYVLISNLGFREYMLRYDPPKEVHYDDVKIASEGDSETIDAVSKTLESVRTDDILNYLIDQADRLGASDIHIENQRDNVRIRLRVDGTLHPVATISHDKYRVLQASIASRANISTAATDAQTGHMQQASTVEPEKFINMRIETVPAAFGMDVVIRLFTFDETILRIDRLGLDDVRRQAIEELVTHPHGMLMAVGPTGSGKSTTLYSILNALNDPTRKIVTLEDPVEMTLTGTTQIPVNTSAGDSFAEKLRAVLRLDPDVVMVGEIRDVDTAKTAVQASITGHLVLSTFHASSAAAAFSRIIDMIGQNPIFASAIRMVVGQRLVRRLDDNTKVAYKPDEATVRWLEEVLRDLPSHVEKPDLNTVQLYHPGHSQEVPFGYSGRIMIMEQLVVTEKIQEFIRGELREISVNAIEAAAKEEGMITMLQDGVLRAIKGETTLEEINRVL